MQVFKTRSTLFGLGKYLQRLMIHMDVYLKGNIFFQKMNYIYVYAASFKVFNLSWRTYPYSSEYYNLAEKYNLMIVHNKCIYIYMYECMYASVIACNSGYVMITEL